MADLFKKATDVEAESLTEDQQTKADAKAAMAARAARREGLKKAGLLDANVGTGDRLIGRLEANIQNINRQAANRGRARAAVKAKLEDR